MAIKGFFNCVHCGGFSAGKKCVWCIAGEKKDKPKPRYVKPTTTESIITIKRKKRWQSDLQIINKELDDDGFINGNRASWRD